MPDSILSHVSVGVADMARARRFYDAAMGALGYGVVMDEPPYGVAYGMAFPEFWIGAAENGAAPSVGNGTHIAFLAPDRAAVDSFHAAALANGGQCVGPPGERAYAPGYYAAFVRDPDGNKIEAHVLPG
jgi:catechol 2,3-dioxygenase-like lactoylglutathione lyase family enzyme